MKRHKPKQQAEWPHSTARISIVSKLNLRLWIRLIKVFFVIDLLLVATAAVTVTIYSEQTIARVIATLDDSVPIDNNLQKILAHTGIQILPLDREPNRLEIPAVLRSFLPVETATGMRRLYLGDRRDISMWHRIDSLQYQLEHSFGPEHHLVVLELASLIRMLKSLFLVLLITELVYALRSIVIAAKIIRHTLRPIVELAERAQTLNTGKGPYTPEEMHALAGKLAGINATHLDKRIEMDGAQDELKTVAEAINGMLDRINASYRAQARFVSDASHELRTPIAAIQGYANLLDRWGKHDQNALQESIDAIKDEAASMKDLIEQLLFLARGDNHAMPLQQELFDLADLTKATLRETEMIDESHQFNSSLTQAFVYADAALVKQALRIVLDNAIKYTPVAGSISVTVTKRDGNAVLCVQDDGIGIPAEAVPRIFDRFYRADESRARATGGTGLGLAIAKWITERHGGHIDVLSRQDLGTRVSILLPAASMPADTGNETPM